MNDAHARRLIIYQSSQDADRQLAETLTLPLKPAGDVRPGIRVDSSERRQRVLGFGGAFTEAAADTLRRISPENRQAVIDAYFHPEKGINYAFCRTHINSCDFSLGNWAYDETPGDTELKDFSIEHDREIIIPFIRDALACRGKEITFFASPWSPPAWMKTNGEMNNGGKLKSEYREVWARYYARYIKAYAAEGINIWGLTVQNEPAATQRWDSCVYTDEDERDFVKILGPILEEEGLGHVKIIVWDHNKDLMKQRVDTIMADPNAARWVWGVGFHWYGSEDAGDDTDNSPLVHTYETYGRQLVFSEGCNPYYDIKDGRMNLVGEWWTGEKYARHIINDLNSYTCAWCDWNLVLDERGGPNHVSNFCDAPIICDTKQDIVHFNSPYYYIAHFSKFIPEDSEVLASACQVEGLESLAAVRPDGQIVTVVLNATDAPKTYTLELDGVHTEVSIPAHAIQTLVTD